MALSEPRGPAAIIISASQARVSENRLRIRLPGEPPTPEPSIEIVRDGESIVGVELTCSCGECVRLKFDYDVEQAGVPSLPRTG